MYGIDVEFVLQSILPWVGVGILTLLILRSSIVNV